MSRLFIDGYEWVEADYMTVNKDLHVKGDFILDGGGSLAFDAIITGSLKVNGPTLGSVGSFTRVIPGGMGSVGSFTRVTVKGSARASRFYGSVGSFTRVIPGGMGSVGSFTRVTVKGSAYGRTFYGSLGSFTRVTIPALYLTGAAPALVKAFTGDTNGTVWNPLGITVDGSWVYMADHNVQRSRIQKRTKSDWSFVSQFATVSWTATSISVDHLNAAGERGSYIFAVHDNYVDDTYYGIKKIRTSDMGLQAELRGSWPRGGGNYGSFLLGRMQGVSVHGGSVYIADINRVYKFNSGLTLGTVLIPPEKFGTETNGYLPEIYGLTTNGTNIFLTSQAYPNINRIRKYDMLGSEIERSSSIQNYPEALVWNKGYIHVANSGQYRVEKWQPTPLSKIMQFTVTQVPYSLDADGSWYWVGEVWAPDRRIEQWTMGAGNITGAGLVVTGGSFTSIVTNSLKAYGSISARQGSFHGRVKAGTLRARYLKGTVKAQWIRGTFGGDIQEISAHVGPYAIGTLTTGFQTVEGTAKFRRGEGTWFGCLGTPTKVFLLPWEQNINRPGLLATTVPISPTDPADYPYGVRGIRVTLGTVPATTDHRKYLWFPWLVPNDFREQGTYIKYTPIVALTQGPPKQGSLSIQSYLYRFRNGTSMGDLRQWGDGVEYNIIGMGRIGSHMSGRFLSHDGLIDWGYAGLKRGDFALLRIGFGTFRSPAGSAYGYHSYGTHPFIVLGLAMEYNSRIQN